MVYTCHNLTAIQTLSGKQNTFLVMTVMIVNKSTGTKKVMMYKLQALNNAYAKGSRAYFCKLQAGHAL